MRGVKHHVYNLDNGRRWRTSGAKNTNHHITAWCLQGWYDWRLWLIDKLNHRYPFRWCRANLVMWALGYEWSWGAPTKCGWCYSCMTDEEREADVARHLEGEV